MREYVLKKEQLNEFCKALQSEERSRGTIEKYLRDIKTFAGWLAGRNVTKEAVAAWKTHLYDTGYAPVTVNSMLAAIHHFFNFMGWPECRVQYLRVQRRLFRDAGRSLERGEYNRLLLTAKAQRKDRLALLMETICATGIRVSEVRYITVEAVRTGRAEVSLKGKIRVILLANKLRRKLQKYAAKQKIASGEIFLTRSGTGLSRRQIWAEMKRLCKHANVEPDKVFPHNLRHLFATTYYKACRDITRLADILGHSSIETTRIYLISTGAEQLHQLDRLGLVL